MTEIRLERRDGVALLTLDAPARRNALTIEMATALAAACDEIDADTDVGAVVVQGAGRLLLRGAARATRSRRRGATPPTRPPTTG